MGSPNPQPSRKVQGRAGTPQGPGLWHYLYPIYLFPSRCCPKLQGPGKPRAHLFLHQPGMALGTKQARSMTQTHTQPTTCRGAYTTAAGRPARWPGTPALGSSPGPSLGRTVGVTHLSEARFPEPGSGSQRAGLAQGGQRGVPRHM